MSDITLEQANAAVSAAHKKAEELGVKMNIAIVDAGANLKTFMRMDNAWLGSIDIAVKKAKTARFFDMPTGVAWRFALQYRTFKRRINNFSWWSSY